MLDAIHLFFTSVSPAGIVGAAACVVIAAAGVTAILVKHFKANKP